jgi:putative transposase
LVEARRLPLRRSCVCVGLSRSAWYAPPLDWTVRDAEFIAALSEAVREWPSRGFWKCSDLLRCQRPDWSPKQIYRVYKAMKLNLRRPAKRRLPKRERVPLYVPRLPDSVWSADFMSDALACGRRFPTFMFARLDDVREAAWWWMLDYNEERPDDALGGMTPAERKVQAAEGSRNSLSA